MRKAATKRVQREEAGIALLISIFVLLLISVVAIALIVSSGTETALAGNYRSSTGVYYAAMAGLEEVRSRLLTKNLNAFKTTDPSFLPSGALPVCNVYYVLNPLGTEAVTPWVSGSTYEDKEFVPEFTSSGCSMPSAPNTANSIWLKNSTLSALPFPAPFYKWVRINGVTEKSLNVDTSPHDTTIDNTLVYYDGANLNDVNSGSQVLELTALAVLPNGSQKLVQYLTAPTPIALPPLPAALTLVGSSTTGPNGDVAYSHPGNYAAFHVDGRDYDCSGTLTANPAFHSIGVFDSTDLSPVVSGGNGGTGIPNSLRPTNYPGQSASPDVHTVNGFFSSTLQTPSGLDGIAQVVIQNADGVITPSSGTASASDLHTATTAAGMSSTNPVTIAINGNLDINNWGNDGYGPGYGLLLVTGTFSYDPDTTWNGIILVIGQGIVNNHGNGGSGQLNGAVLVAKTRGPGPSFSLLSSLGGATVDFDPNMNGNGVYYSSCWIQKAQPTSDYKVLSFHEIAQQ